MQENLLFLPFHAYTKHMQMPYLKEIQFVFILTPNAFDIFFTLLFSSENITPEEIGRVQGGMAVDEHFLF